MELEARESVERTIRAEAKRDAACHEAAMAKLATEGAVNTRAHIDSELARVQRALALAEEARRRAEFEHGVAREALVAVGEACKKAEEENGRLADEKLTLVIELRAVNDEFAAFREKAAVDKEKMEVEFDSSSGTLFNYGYGCCVFMHNICGSKPQIPDGMLDPSIPLTPEFFANPRCPPSISSAARTLDTTVSGEDEHPGSSPIAVGEEVVLPIDPPTVSDGGVEDVVATRV